MKVFIERTKEEGVSSAGTVADLLQELDINPGTVLVVRDGVLVPEDASLEGAKEVKVLSVISGG